MEIRTSGDGNWRQDPQENGGGVDRKEKSIQKGRDEGGSVRDRVKRERKKERKKFREMYETETCKLGEERTEQWLSNKRIRIE